jgi:N-methylhydantoinase A
MTDSSIRIGVDIGGTFTDVVVYRDERAHASAQDPHDPQGSRASPCSRPSRSLAAEHDLPAREITRFVHGTTVATNAVLERKGARTGLITTAGFRGRAGDRPPDAPPAL